MLNPISRRALAPVLKCLLGTEPEDESSGELAMRRLGFILFACLFAGCGGDDASTEADDARAW
jgi:hypothetical protein